MKNLLDLQLSIPTIDELTSRKLMGGSGYVSEGPDDPPSNIPEWDHSHDLPPFDPNLPPLDPPEDRNPGNYDGPPTGFETDYDIPEPNMEPVEVDTSNPNDDRPDSNNNESDEEYDQDDLYNDEDRPDENDNIGDNNQGDTGDQGSDSEHIQPDSIEILVSQLSAKQQQFLKDYHTLITINPTLGQPGLYDQKYNIIGLQNAADTLALFSETVHAKQYSMNMLNDTNRSNNEFQQHVLADILHYYTNPCEANSMNILDKDYSKYIIWLDDITHGGDKTQPFNMEIFLKEVDYFFNSFREQYKYSGPGDKTYDPGYSKDPNPNYNWQWDDYIEFMLPDNETKGEKPSSGIMMGN